MDYKVICKDVTKMLPEYSTAHCISNDCAMGAGVVIAFRNSFPGLKDACIEYMQTAQKNPDKFSNNRGVYMPYRHKDDNVGVVYNMFTKESCQYHAGIGITYNDYLNNLEDSLKYVRELMTENNETKLAMPKIGCGIDGCNWKDVQEIILNVFNDTEFDIVICDYTPNK